MDNNGKINRGIDLGTTNSAIAVMENGVPVIKKSQTQKDPALPCRFGKGFGI